MHDAASVFRSAYSVFTQPADDVVTYEQWKDDVPSAITGDPLWRQKAYRLGLFASDIGWHDAQKLLKDRRTKSLSDQLYRALGSISANIAEGYSRGTGKGRALFYEYALGSARGSRDWYYKSRFVLGERVVEHRLQLLTEIIRLLLATIPRQRGQRMREPEASYKVFPMSTPDRPGHQDIPLPL